MLGITLESYGKDGYNLSPNFGVARGDFKHLTAINKFGFNGTVGSTFETVWSESSVYTYPATQGTILLTSSDSDDNGSTVQVTGLDGDYNEVTETLEVGGSEGTQNFIRVYRMILINANTGTSNVGKISARHTDQSSTQITVAAIPATIGQTLMTNYTVPAGYSAYITRFYSTVDVKDKQATIIGVARPFGQNAWNTKAYFTSNGNTVNYHFDTPLKFPAKTDFEVRAKSPTGVGITGVYDLILEQNT